MYSSLTCIAFLQLNLIAFLFSVYFDDFRAVRNIYSRITLSIDNSCFKSHHIYLIFYYFVWHASNLTLIKYKHIDWYLNCLPQMCWCGPTSRSYSGFSPSDLRSSQTISSSRGSMEPYSPSTTTLIITVWRWRYRSRWSMSSYVFLISHHSLRNYIVIYRFCEI